jgi:DNA-binding XRE family transcriptional regulator
MAKPAHPQQAHKIRPYFREWRKSAGLSQETLAKRMGISAPTVHKHETEGRISVRFDYLEKFAMAVGCNPWDPIAGPPGVVPQINQLLGQLQPDDLDLIHRIIELFVDRSG